MVYLIKYWYTMLADIFEHYSDPRVKHLPLVGHPLPFILIIAGYLAFVLHYGPKWMEGQKPFELKYIMRAYNAIQVLANLVMLLFGLPNSYLRREFSLTCQPIDHTNTEPWMLNLIYISYGYYLTKYLDLFDTIFIVLRKKNKQITFLHVYHHAGMVFAVYVFLKFLAGSHSTMLGVVNLFVHVVMYLYYFITSIRSIQSTLWWKRHITQIQLLQFGYLSIHFMFVLVKNDCDHPTFIAMVGFLQNIFMFALFFDFYCKAYLRKSTGSRQSPTLATKSQPEAVASSSSNNMSNKSNKSNNISKSNCIESEANMEKSSGAISPDATLTGATKVKQS